MRYGDEYFVELSESLDPDELSRARLATLFRNARRISAFESTPNDNFIHELDAIGITGPLCYRIDQDCMIEINDAFLKDPVVIRNKVADWCL